MLTPREIPYTAKVVNRLEEWSIPNPAPSLLDRLFPARIVASGTIAVCGSMESVVAGLHFLILLVPVIVKSTLELAQIRHFHGYLPRADFNSLKLLAHRSAALAAYAIIGSSTALSGLTNSVAWYDFFKLTRRIEIAENSSSFSKWEEWSHILHRTFEQFILSLKSSKKGVGIGGVILLAALMRRRSSKLPVYPEKEPESSLPAERRGKTLDFSCLTEGLTVEIQPELVIKFLFLGVFAAWLVLSFSCKKKNRVQINLTKKFESC